MIIITKKILVRASIIELSHAFIDSHMLDFLQNLI